jgi:Acyltransferase family/Ankyrin repeats (3 copies)
MDEPATEITRRNDLDALRGFAMVLGIGLHASLSFFEMFWPVQDTAQSPALAWFFFAIHGFRMQLFFLISGYFTMMLFQRRGLRALIVHRLKRIALPLAIGMFTIVPLIDWSASWAVERGVASWMEEQAMSPAAVQRREELIEAGLVTAARAGDLSAVESLLASGQAPDTRDEKAITGLHWAAFGGHTEVMRALVAAGVDVNIGDGSDGRPLHWAAFFSRPESVEALLELGADPKALNGTKETPADTVRAAWGDETIGVLNFIGMLIGAKLDIERIAAARPQVRALLGVEDRAGSQTAAKLPADPEAVDDGQVFHHLWFLWFLIQLVALFAVFAGLGSRIPALARVGEFVRSPLGLGMLVVLTIVPQLQMGAALPIPSFGPDTDSSWLVAPHLLGYYALFFFFGVGSYRVDGTGLRYRGFSMLALPLAFFGLLPIAMQIIFEPEQASIWLGADRLRAAEAAIETLYPWLVSFGMIGLFRVLLSRRNAAVRYLSDASYWMYLIHLPLIFIAQAWIRDLDASVWLKFSAVTCGVTAVSVISYAILVRPTPIGTLLNGRRKRSIG